MLTEGHIIDRFGWTFEELDRQDTGRTFQTVAMMNIAQMYKDVLKAVEKHSTGSLTSAHWETYKMMQGLGEDDI